MNSPYTPILKWKTAEMVALENVPVSSRKNILPLIEIVMPTVDLRKDVIIDGKKEKVKKTEEEVHFEILKKYNDVRLNKIPDEIKKSWGSSSLLLDFSLVHDGVETVGLKIHSLKSVLRACKDIGAEPTLVINLYDDEKIIEAAASELKMGYTKGLCVRITVAGLQKIGETNTRLKTLLEKYGIKESDVDILADLKYYGTDTTINYAEVFGAAQQIIYLDSWRNFIFASGSFPTDVSKHKLEDSPSPEPRLDWQLWCACNDDEKLKRKPSFADYTIRNPIHNEVLQFIQASATLKYTHEDGWQIFRGQKQKNEQFLTHAHLLVTATALFYGKDFSFGDNYIDQKATHYHEYMKDNSKKGMGRSWDWIAAGISHHIALVMSQLSSHS